MKNEKTISENNPIQDKESAVHVMSDEGKNPKANMEHLEFSLKQEISYKTLTQQKIVITWIIIIGASWLFIVVIAFIAIIVDIRFIKIRPPDDTSVATAITLIASGTSAAVVGPMLVAYAVFKRNLQIIGWAKLHNLQIQLLPHKIFFFKTSLKKFAFLERFVIFVLSE